MGHHMQEEGRTAYTDHLKENSRGESDVVPEKTLEGVKMPRMEMLPL